MYNVFFQLYVVLMCLKVGRQLFVITLSNMTDIQNFYDHTFEQVYNKAIISLNISPYLNRLLFGSSYRCKSQHR